MINHQLTMNNHVNQPSLSSSPCVAASGAAQRRTTPHGRPGALHLAAAQSGEPEVAGRGDRPTG